LFEIITFFSERAGFALRFSCDAVVSSEKDKGIVEHSMVFFGKSSAYFFVCFERCFCIYESKPVEDSMHMRIYSDIRGI
jgi:hypothetical protein